MTTASRPGVLSGARRFAAVRAWRVQRSSGVIRAAAAPSPHEVSRVGFALSGVRTAVLRNRLRRRLRAAVREPLAQHPGLDVVVSAGAAAAQAPYAVIAGDVALAIHAVAAAVTARLRHDAVSS